MLQGVPIRRSCQLKGSSNVDKLIACRITRCPAAAAASTGSTAAAAAAAAMPSHLEGVQAITPKPKTIDKCTGFVTNTASTDKVMDTDCVLPQSLTQLTSCSQLFDVQVRVLSYLIDFLLCTWSGDDCTRF
jgi:hypothetical protein